MAHFKAAVTCIHQDGNVKNRIHTTATAVHFQIEKKKKHFSGQTGWSLIKFDKNIFFVQKIICEYCKNG